MLKSPLRQLFRIAPGLLFLLTAAPAWAQNVPADLEVIGTAGGLSPTAGYATVSIASDGQGTYNRFQSSALTSPVLESSTFSLTAAEVEQLWQVIQDGDFFNLEAEYAAGDIIDRTFARLIITANGSVHAVTTQNIAVAGFDDIISTINDLTPGDADLVYDTSEPFTFTSLDICEQPGILAQGVLSKQINEASGEPAVVVLTAADTHPLNDVAHAGTVVAYHMTLQQAIGRGIVTLTAKGGSNIFGDAVSISIDNSSSVTNDRLTLSLYLEFWGPAASVSTSLKIENAIESMWGGHTTTGGQPVTMDVVTRTTPGGASAPGTQGFHQIELVTSGVVPSVHSNGDLINQGVASGTWITTHKEFNVDTLYAHEAGHLFDLRDRYEDYRKQPDDTWIRQSDGETFTTSTLAKELDPLFSELNESQVKAKLEEPGRERITAPMAGHENDLMAGPKGSVQQSDIDALAAQAGLIIEVRPGTILVNKDGGDQNFVIIRSEDIFVPPGGTKTLGGLYVACVDGGRGFPSEGIGFDLAPSMSDWRGIEAAHFLQMVVDHVDEQERFCRWSGYVPQSAVWRITGNTPSSQDSNVDAFLLDVGIDLGDRILDFPRMTSPNAADSSTSSVTPLELFILDIASSAGKVLTPGETVEVTGVVHAPVGVVASTVISWSLDPPTGSAATLTSQQGETTFFIMDVRGIYRVLMQAEVTDTLANTFTLETVDLFTAADAYTETFETGILEPGGPFYWETSKNNPWIVTDRESHSGVFSAASADIGDNGMTTITAIFEQVADDTMSFAYKVSSQINHDFLLFSIDGEVQGSWSGLLDWSTFAINLLAGKHTAIWTYEKDGSIFHSLDRAWIDDVFFPESSLFTSIESPADDVLPATYQLSQNYPNPFNPTTTITYAIPQAQHVRLVVYNALGQQVAILVEGQRNPGQYQVQFDAGGLSNGVYYYELRAGTFTQRKAMVLLK